MTVRLHLGTCIRTNLVVVNCFYPVHISAKTVITIYCSFSYYAIMLLYVAGRTTCIIVTKRIFYTLVSTLYCKYCPTLIVLLLIL